MKLAKTNGVLLVSLLAAQVSLSNTWNPNVAVGAKWSDAGNWSTGVPGTGDTAIFNQTQANTLDVDVDVSGQTRLQQVSLTHAFGGTGSIAVSANPVAHFQHIMHNTTTGTVVYNVPVSLDTQGSAYWGQSTHLNGGTTVFNDSYTLTSGSLLNLKGGTHTFNSDLNLAGSMRLDGTVIIGGSGTTTISTDYISTAGAGSVLHLNRTGAYTLANTASGYLRLEKTKVVFNAVQALGAGTNVKTYELDPSSALVSGGDYDQDFGYLACFGNGGTIDMQNTACIWTFADSSAQGWVKLDITNVGSNTVVRFARGSGGGLTELQIGKTRLNGATLTTGDTTVDGGYLYVTPTVAGPEPEPMPDLHDPVYVGYYRGMAMDEGIYTFSDPTQPLATASRIGTWPFPSPIWQGIGFDGTDYFVFNRGTSFGGPGLHRYDGETGLPLISGSHGFSDWHGIGYCNGVYYGLYSGSGLNGPGLYIFMDPTDPESTAVQVCKNQAFPSNVWTDIAFDGERYLFVRTDADGGTAGIYQYNPDTDGFGLISGSETYADWEGLGVYDADIVPQANQKAYVLLFGGQSNALGWGYRQYLLDTGDPLAMPQADIDMFHGLNLYVPKDTLVPLQSGTGNTVVKPLPNHYPALTTAPISRFASELTFARTTLDLILEPDARLGVVKYAMGGTSLYDPADWRPDGTADRAADGLQYRRFQETAWKGIAAMKNKYPYHSVEILGMGWVQGESDAIEGHADEYGEHLERLVIDVRATFGDGLPFVLSMLSTNQLEGAPQNEIDQWPILMAAQQAVAAADPKVAATETAGTNYAVSVGLSEGRYHYTTPALLRIGTDLANALVPISGVNAYEEWAAGFTLSGTNALETADPDGDGLGNLCEYGLGGDPTNGANTGISPSFDPSADTGMEYLYPRLSDPSPGVDYSLELTDDLVSGDWKNSGYTETGTRAINTGFEWVTNHVPTAGKNLQMIRLQMRDI